MNHHFRFEIIPQEPFEEKALQYIAANDPVALLKKCRKRHGDLEKGTRRLNWQLWTACYAGALGIHRQPHLFNKLLEDDYFEQRTYKPSIDDILRLAMLIGTDADATGRTYKKACSIAKCLKPLFDAKIEPMEVLARIEASGGLKRLYIDNAAAPADADTDNNEHDAEDVEAGDEDEEEYGNRRVDGHENDNAVATTKTARSRGRSRSGPSRPSSKPKPASATFDQHTRKVEEGHEILEVEVTKEMLIGVLEGSHAMMFLKNVGESRGRRRIVGVTVTAE